MKRYIFLLLTVSSSPIYGGITDVLMENVLSLIIIKLECLVLIFNIHCFQLIYIFVDPTCMHFGKENAYSYISQ
uniref:Uncharacterized protein n=1 Tax=Anguilla anguilla TaxID=7936 RepID=A0A0E9WH68_ANGAN